jgi:hypothetical protein
MSPNQSSALSTKRSFTIPDPRKGPAGRRFIRATTIQTPASDPGQRAVQALTGQRLTIPCRNSTRGLPSAATIADQSRRAGTPVRSKPATSGLGMAPFQSGGGVALIVWHKDDQLNSPIFVLDARGGPLKDAKQQAIADTLKGRARVDLIDGGVALVVDEARLDDAGLYTCTVEFDRAPTQAYQTSVGVSGKCRQWEHGYVTVCPHQVVDSQSSRPC